MPSHDHDTWPFRQARAIDQDTSQPVIFETGFGPSGFPHVGTLAEVVRTSWVRQAFEHLTDGEIDTELIVFSDDLDGLRDIPDNMPQQDMLFEHLGVPLYQVPNPFGKYDSFADHMHARLHALLEGFGLEQGEDYTFRRSSNAYNEGRFDGGLRSVLDHRDAIRDVILPTLQEWRREQWDPFFPICEACGKVYTTRVIEVDPDHHTLTYSCDTDRRSTTPVQPCGHEGEVPVTGGSVKVNWKVDWALRWHALDVDYEMYGKDLIESHELSSEIVEILGGSPPEGVFCEMFLNESGRKISKSEGETHIAEVWSRYAPLEALAWFMFQSPQRAAKFYLDRLPDIVNRWLESRSEFIHSSAPLEDHVLWFIDPMSVESDEANLTWPCEVNYSTLLNLIGTLHTDEPDLVWDYLLDYDDSIHKRGPEVRRLIKGALRFYNDHRADDTSYEPPSDDEAPYVEALRDRLRTLGTNPDAETIQSEAYDIGNESHMNLGKWFSCLYRLLLGQKEGPRFGHLVDMLGVDTTIEMIERRVPFLSPHPWGDLSSDLKDERPYDEGALRQMLWAWASGTVDPRDLQPVLAHQAPYNDLPDKDAQFRTSWKTFWNGIETSGDAFLASTTSDAVETNLLSATGNDPGTYRGPQEVILDMVITAPPSLWRQRDATVMLQYLDLWRQDLPCRADQALGRHIQETDWSSRLETTSETGGEVPYLYGHADGLKRTQGSSDHDEAAHLHATVEDERVRLERIVQTDLLERCPPDLRNPDWMDALEDRSQVFEICNSLGILLHRYDRLELAGESDNYEMSPDGALTCGGYHISADTVLTDTAGSLSLDDHEQTARDVAASALEWIVDVARAGVEDVVIGARSEPVSDDQVQFTLADPADIPEDRSEWWGD